MTTITLTRTVGLVAILGMLAIAVSAFAYSPSYIGIGQGAMCDACGGGSYNVETVATGKTETVVGMAGMDQRIGGTLQGPLYRLQ